jgi:WD40 repeat protein
VEFSKPLKLGVAERLSYSADGKRLAVRSSQLSVWNLENHKRLWRANPVPYLDYATFSPDGKLLAVKSTTGQIVVVRADTGKVVCDFRNRKDDEGCNLLFSPCGKYIVDGTWEDRLLVREAATGKIHFEREFPTK